MTGTSRGVVVAMVVVALLAVAAGATGVAAQNGTNNSSTNATAQTGPYELEELRSWGVRGSEAAPPSVRRYGDGQLWLRYAPASIGGNPDDSQTYQYLTKGTTIKRDEVYLGGFIGWGANEELDVTIVYWNDGEQRVEDDEGNVRYVPAAVDQTVDETSVTLSGGYAEEAIELRPSYDEARHVTMFVEGEEGSATWRFDVKTSPTAEPVNVDTAGDLALWAVGFLILTLVLTLALMKIAHRWHERAGKGPGYPIWLYLAGVVPVGFMTLMLGYRNVLDTIAQAPWILVPGVALFATIAAINWWGDDTERVGIIHVDLTSPQANEDGSGEIPVNVRTYEIAEVGGVRGLVVNGITPYLARARGAIPELRLFCMGEERTSDPSLEFSGGTGIFDTIYFADPFDEDPLTVEREGWSLSHLYDAPEIDPEASTVDRVAVHASSIAWEKIIPAIGIVAAGWILGGALAASGAIGALVALLPAGMWVGRPIKGRAEWHVAPSSFGSVIVSLINATEQLEEVADRDYFKSKYQEELGKNVAERKKTKEETELGKFDEVLSAIEEGNPESLSEAIDDADVSGGATADD
ncbi:hypothetical protein [Halobellus captivus]|uniref:hypothetical protein n=1 Tax=Halobellus captivus TaxID=2592614 RepID=UPI00119EE7C2|nr:hypothetical protein [Halobellus captivus]